MPKTVADGWGKVSPFRNCRNYRRPSQPEKLFLPNWSRPAKWQYQVAKGVVKAQHDLHIRQLHALAMLDGPVHLIKILRSGGISGPLVASSVIEAGL
jgi:hypothetical protein